MAAGTFSASAICIRREPLTRFVPVSYFWICWKDTPQAFPSSVWLMPAATRAARMFSPTTTSAGIGRRLGMAALVSGGVDRGKVLNCERVCRPMQRPIASPRHRHDPRAADYARWLGGEPEPCDLIWPYPAELMRMSPISTRVNKAENDDPSIIDLIELATSA